MSSKDKRISLELELVQLENRMNQIKKELAMYNHTLCISNFDRSELKGEDIRAMGIDYVYKPFTQVLSGYCGTAYLSVPKDLMNRDYFEKTVSDWMSGRLADFDVEDFLLNTNNI